MAITITLAQIKAVDNFPASEDAFITTLVSSVTTFVEDYLKRSFEVTDYIEKRNGNGLSMLFTNQYPINSITSLTQIDKDNVVTYTWANTDYIFEGGQGRVQLRSGTFPQGLQNIKIVYNAGFATLPKDLEQAFISHVLWEKANRQGKDFGLKTKSLGDGGYQVYEQGIPSRIKMIYDLYKKFGN